MVNQPRQWYQIRNTLPADSGHPEILIYDVIDSMFGVSAADFVQEINKIDAPEITVRINSPGGAVFDGIAILNALRGHNAKITTIVDGIAASIASVIAMGGDEIVMNRNSQLMIHNAWDLVIGNADELQAAADRLRQFSGNIASIYADRAGGTVADWQALMDAETWYTAEEAVAAGLADLVVVDTVKETPPSYARAAAFDLSKFKYAGRQAAPAPHIVARAQAPQPVEAEVNQGKEPIVATLNESLVEKLGLDADADDETILAKVSELAEHADDKPAETEPAPVAEPSSEQITTAAAKLGLALVDRDQYESTQAAVRELQAVRNAQVKADDERLIDEAIRAGKLAPANKANWLTLMETDRVGIRATLAQLPAGLIPVAEMGHGVGSEEDHLDSELAHVFAKVTGLNIDGKDA